MQLDLQQLLNANDRSGALREIAAQIETATLAPEDIRDIEAMLRDTTISSDVRREVSRALLRHTRRESTQRLPLMWQAKSSDEEFRATDEIIAETAVASPDLYPMPTEAPTAEHHWESMPLPADATADTEEGNEDSALIHWHADNLEALVPQNTHTLRFNRRIYEGVSRDGVVSLLRRGVLLGMDVLSTQGWVRILDSEAFRPLVHAFEDETLRVMDKFDVASEIETLEDLFSTSDITRPFEPDAPVPLDEVDAILEADDEPPTMEFSVALPPSEDLDTNEITHQRGQAPVPRGAWSQGDDDIVDDEEEPAASHTLVARPSRMPRKTASDSTAEIPKTRFPTAELPGVQAARAALPMLREPIRPLTVPTSVVTHKPQRRRTSTVVALGLALAGAALVWSTQTEPEPQIQIISVAPRAEQAVEQARGVVHKAQTFDMQSTAFLTEAADALLEDAPAATTSLRTRLFDRDPTADRALDVARGHAAAGDFAAAREWLRTATYLDADPGEVVAMLREAIANDATLRATTTTYTPPSLTTFVWDAKRREFLVVTEGLKRGVFVADTRRADALIAESRLCEAIACSHRVARALPVRVDASHLRHAPGFKRAAGMVEGAMLEAVSAPIEQAPVELRSVWASWLNAESPVPTGSFAANLLAWDRIDVDLRPDFAARAVGYDAKEMTRQLSSLFLTDFLTANPSRTQTTVGHFTAFDGKRLVSTGTPSFGRVPAEVATRVKETEKVDQFTYLALRSLTPESTYGVFTGLSAAQRESLNTRRLEVLSRLEGDLNASHAKNVLIPR